MAKEEAHAVDASENAGRERVREEGERQSLSAAVVLFGGCEDERERQRARPPVSLLVEVKMRGTGVGGRWARAACGRGGRPGKSRKEGENEDGGRTKGGVGIGMAGVHWHFQATNQQRLAVEAGSWGGIAAD